MSPNRKSLRTATRWLLAGNLLLSPWMSAAWAGPPGTLPRQVAKPQPLSDAPRYSELPEQPAPVLWADGQIADQLQDEVRRFSLADNYTESDDVALAQMMMQPGGMMMRTQPPTQPARPTPPTPTPPRPTDIARALPRFSYMFGDFGDPGMAALQPQAVVLNQLLSGFFVTNALNGNGAANNPAVQVFVHSGSANGPIVAQSIGAGIDVSGDGQADTYPISEPVGVGAALPPGSTFNGGNVVFVNVPPPNTSGTAADGSVGQAANWNLLFSHNVANQVVIPIAPGGGSSGGSGGGGGGATIRRVKIGENASPQPRDRLLFTYNFFNDVIGGVGDVNRYILGFEKTFLDELGSIEVRVPFASTLSSDQVVTNIGAHDTEIGNAQCVFKVVLLRSDDWLLSAGTGVSLPTADDVRYFLPNGSQIVNIRNDAVRLLPFVGYMRGLGERAFVQTFMQFEVDTSGNPTTADLSGTNLQPIGRLRDPTLMFLDLQLGYHLIDNPEGEGLTDLSPLMEVHYTTSLEDAPTVAGNGVALAPLANRLDTVNLTAAMNMVFRDRLSVRPGIVIPLSSGTNRIFDYEAGLQVNMKY